MKGLETRLTVALHADTPSEHDPVFRVEVLVRLEQARFRRQVRRTMASAALFAVLAAVNVPVLDAWITADGSWLWFVALVAPVAVSVLSVALIEPRVRTLARAAGRMLYP